MPAAPAPSISDDDLESLMRSDHRVIARLAAELLASRREVCELRRLLRRETPPTEDGQD